MKNGYIEPSDADTMMGIYRKIDIVSGFLNEPLVTSEAVLIFCIAKSIKEGKVKEVMKGESENNGAGSD